MRGGWHNEAKVLIPIGLIVLIGPPSAGKSSFAKALKKAGDVAVVSSDDIGEELFDVEFDPVKHDDVVFAVRDSRLGSPLRSGKAAIADSTSVTAHARLRLVRLARVEGVPVTALRFLSSLEAARRLNANRDKHVENIEWFFNELDGVTPDSLKTQGFDLVADVVGAEQEFAPEEAARRFQIGEQGKRYVLLSVLLVRPLEMVAKAVYFILGLTSYILG